METYKLKNGAVEAAPLVKATMMSIRSLDPISLYELVEVARKPDHQPFGNTGEKLKGLALLEPASGGFGPATRMHDSIRNIVLSAAQGEGLELELVSPVAS